ncbi:hypothetical protein ALC60_09334 [Trachymyrmex zeteki]|uniref:Uncharacterized protein n=1 Tax=Mycetomoellerius zeteki TaxID=64791 RepID=A0A151WUR3_9HYME|nr:hypothetical protein ALC60_09334 [Trachymyrmex zeteki]
MPGDVTLESAMAAAPCGSWRHLAASFLGRPETVRRFASCVGRHSVVRCPRARRDSRRENNGVDLGPRTSGNERERESVRAPRSYSRRGGGRCRIESAADRPRRPRRRPQIISLRSGVERRVTRHRHQRRCRGDRDESPVLCAVLLEDEKERKREREKKIERRWC